MSYFLYFCLWLICCFILSVIIRFLNGGESLDLFEEDEPFLFIIVMCAYAFSPITVLLLGTGFFIVYPLIKYVFHPFLVKWGKLATSLSKKLIRFKEVMDKAIEEE